MGFPSETGDAVEGQGASRPDRAHAGAGRAFRESSSADGAVSRGARDGHVRAGLLLGRRAQVLGGAGRVHDGGRLRRRLHAQSHVRRGVLRPHRPQRGRAGGLRSQANQLRGHPEDLLGEPRPDPGHASGQRRRHAVPLGDLRVHARAASAGRSLARRVSAALVARRGSARSRRRSSTRRSSTTRRTITSSTSPRTPAATAGSAAPASRVRPASSRPPASVPRVQRAFSACQTRSGRSGMSRCRTPNVLSASTTALTIAGVAPMVAASPMPLAPIGLRGDGVTV